MHIPKAALSALQNNLPAVFGGHIRNDLSGFCLTDDGSRRDLQDNICAILSVAAALAALLSVLSREFCLMPVIIQGIEAFIHFKNHIAASSAVTAVWTAVRYIELSSEAYMPVSAFSCPYKYFCSVCKHFTASFL